VSHYFVVAFWLNRNEPAKRWYTPKTDEDRAMFRLGPVVMAWEVNRHD
jgi:hypothetical protein